MKQKTRAKARISEISCHFCDVSCCFKSFVISKYRKISKTWYNRSNNTSVLQTAALRGTCANLRCKDSKPQIEPESTLPVYSANLHTPVQCNEKFQFLGEWGILDKLGFEVPKKFNITSPPGIILGELRSEVTKQS